MHTPPTPTGTNETSGAARPALTNAEIADRLMGLAQFLSARKENPYRIKAYRRAAKSIRSLSESLDDLVREGADLTRYAGIGKGISGAIRELIVSGSLRQFETLRTQVSPEVAAIAVFPRLDPARVLRIYKKLGIGTLEELKERLEAGEIAAKLGARMESHVRQALAETHEMLLYDADPIAASVREFLLTRCGARRATAAGDYRRRVAVLSELVFVIETDQFPALVSRLERFGGRAERLSADEKTAVLKLSSGILLRVQSAVPDEWGLELIRYTGSQAHIDQLEDQLEAAALGLEKLARSKQPFPEEADVYRALGLSFIEPELREGLDEVELARKGALPVLISAAEIRGELHAHSTSSDGRNTIEQMARAAREKGYEYVGITDHSQSLKIAGGLSEDDLWKQIRYIDKLKAISGGIRILKSAEVDILPDGSLDYPDALLKELDYTVCSIHSRFGLGKIEQTERIVRAMDNRYFSILGHATGRLLLKRTGYEIDFGRVIEHARSNGCFFEINSSPDRLDLPWTEARLAARAGIKIAVSTDAHSAREYELIRYGV
ncbi:MAG TPA: PHP domain-containing protein, partial [Bryobacteraceae bacterium]|nr:PHP domain-containing protein [Bryobacteraceae bacterium]